MVTGMTDQQLPGRAGQPAQTGREDSAERLTEDPHDESPAHADRPGQPGPRPARRDEEPGADPDLNPDRGGPGLDGVEGPDGAAPVDQVLDPARRRRRGRLDDLRG